MRQSTLPSLLVASLLALGSTAALAQSSSYTGPSNPSPNHEQRTKHKTGHKHARVSTLPAPVPFTGANSVPLTTVKKLQETGLDDQYARLQGKIISHNGRKYYTFEDATGSISAKIHPMIFPDNKKITATTRVELLGEFDKGRRADSVEVKRITLLP